MHCVTDYPVQNQYANLQCINTLQKDLKIQIGYSDHTKGVIAPLIAVSKGAKIIEKHFTLDKDMEGPDHILSLLPDEFEDMIEKLRIVETALGDGIKQPAPSETASIIRFRKTMYSKHDISEGSIITADDIIYTGPAYGIYAKYEDLVHGQQARKDIPANTPITWDLITNA